MQQETKNQEIEVLNYQDLTKKVSFSKLKIYYWLYYLQKFCKRTLLSKIIFSFSIFTIIFGIAFLGILFKSSILLIIGIIFYCLSFIFFLVEPEDYIFKKDIIPMIRWFK